MIDPAPTPPSFARRPVWQPVGLILGTALLTFFTGLGVPALFDQDEGFFASTALEMHRRADWIVPTFNGELFGHKPPFMFWMMRLGFLIWGENELGARFFSAIFGTLTAIVTFALGRHLFPSRSADTSSSGWHDPATWAGLIMASCLMFGVVSRAATPDSYLVGWISVALLAYVRSVPLVWSTESSATMSIAQLLPQAWSGWLALYAAMGMAVLVKGPIGILLPGATIGLFVILAILSQNSSASGWSRGWSWVRGLFTTLPFRVMWAMHPVLAIVVVLIIAGPWFAVVGWMTNGQFLVEFFGTHNVGRFLNPMENHRGPLWYYIPITLVGFFPWSVFALPTTTLVVRQLFGRRDVPRSTLFLACWLVVMIGFFSIASTKLPSYVLPAYPAIALLTAAWLVSWLRGDAAVWSGWPAISWSIFSTVGAGILVGIPLLNLNLGDQTLAHRVNLNESVLVETVPLMSIGLIPLLTGSLALYWLWRKQPTTSAAMFAAGSVTFSVALLAGAAIIVDRHQHTAELVQAADARDARHPEVATFGYFQPSMVFYSQRPVIRLIEVSDAEDYLQGSGRTMLVTTAGREAFETQSSLPLEVLEERPNFPKPGALYIVRAADQTAIRDSAVQPASYESPAPSSK